jgi:hypothetical protein
MEEANFDVVIRDFCATDLTTRNRYLKNANQSLTRQDLKIGSELSATLMENILKRIKS